MSVITTYDEKRHELREKLKECLDMAEELVVGKNIWGYEDMCKGYAIDVYKAISDAIDTVGNPMGWD